ncbi:MAG: Wzz/FepE/Etk N-terminal domain-containing protein [Thermomicrobium sp.]|nr:Wzz/FepE/Etk N-terminal domain-containing protein [Thermomicrobium sp.]MCS7246586.1 Wzz/FepE/Etk N-terminal domain-containing protein [Thermomicrobium sp.]MDW7982931.1 Wzz/FepE/Etk N-terminal domain-containing protein [Thermomicrobium sp.]
MELRAYLTILWRRRWLVALVPALALVAIAVQALQYQPRYTATASVVVTRFPQEVPSDVYRYDEYYLYLTNEYTVDDFTEVIRGNVFARDVAQRASELLGTALAPHQVQASIDVRRRNRAVLLSVTANDASRATAIARSAVDLLRERGTQYFGFTDPDRQVIVQVVNEPRDAVADTARTRLIWAVQLLLAVAFGIFLAFLADYLADALHDPEDIRRALGVPVLAVVPMGSERKRRAS